MAENPKQKCPICGIKEVTPESESGGRDILIWNCPVCGKFRTSEEFARRKVVESDYVKDKWKVSGAVKEKNLEGKHDLLLSEKENDSDPKIITVEELMSSVSIPQNPSQKIDKFLGNIDSYSNIKKITDSVFEISQEELISLFYARDQKEVTRLLRYAEGENLIDGVDLKSMITFRLTLKAWNRIEELKQINKDSKQVFVACWFPDKKKFPKEYARRKEIQPKIKSAIEKEDKYKIKVVDEEYFNGTILEKALGEIRKSRAIVVDLTGLRRSVFYEAGFAFGLGLDPIFISDAKEKDAEKEFYSRHYQILYYEDGQDLEEKLSAAIAARIV